MRLSGTPRMRPTRRVPAVVRGVAAGALVVPLMAFPGRSWAASGPIAQAAEHMGLTRYAVERVTIASQGARRVVRLPLDGSAVTLELEPISLRSPAFRVLVQDGQGSPHEVTAPPPATYGGSVAEHPDWRVAAAVRGDRLTAIIVPAEGLPYLVEPVDPAHDGGGPSSHFVYRSDAVADEAGVCATNGQAEPVEPSLGAPAEPGPPLKLAEVAFDTDYEFFQKNQGSVDATVEDIELIMNGVNVVYERDCQIWHQISSVIVRTTPGPPYTSNLADSLLIQLAIEWAANQFNTPRDLVHLMTGKNLSGNIIGIAILGGVCNKSRGYGLSESRYSAGASYNARLSLTAHELGHQWNAVHCDASDTCNIMCSILTGCDGLGLPNFESRGVNYIRGFAANRTCLGTVQLAVEPSPRSAGNVRLDTPRPSPFGDNTRLRYYVERRGNVRLSVFDVGGRRVALLVDGEVEAGWHEVPWDGRTSGGVRLGPGVFHARLETEGMAQGQRIVLVR